MPDIPDYDLKKIIVEKSKLKISDKDIDNSLSQIAEKHERFTPLKTKRKTKIGDLVLFDYEGKIDKKAFPDRVEIKKKSCQHLDANFDRFGSQLGSIWGGFWRPGWTQVGTKWQQTRPHNQSKI